MREIVDFSGATRNETTTSLMRKVMLSEYIPLIANNPTV